MHRVQPWRKQPATGRDFFCKIATKIERVNQHALELLKKRFVTRKNAGLVGCRRLRSFPCWGPVRPISRGEMLSVLISNLDIKVKGQFSKIPIELPSDEARFGPHRIVWLLEQTSKRVWYNCLFSQIWAQTKSTLQKKQSHHLHIL